MCKKTLVG